MRDVVIGNWRKLRNEGLYKLYSSSNAVRMNMSKRLRWAGQIEHMGEKREK
jgi:hypothetical protein